MKTVAVIEGFAGGPILTRPFRKALRAAGFKVMRNRRTADIIIAHSAGMYAIPAEAKASLIMIIGPTWWPGKKLTVRAAKVGLRRRQYILKKHGWWQLIWTQANQFFYFFVRHRYLWLGIINNNRLDFLDRLSSKPNRKVILVRNQEDDFTSPGIKQVVKNYPNLEYFELPGVHDAFATEPAEYIKLIKDAL